MPKGYLGRTVTTWTCETCGNQFSVDHHPSSVHRFCSKPCADMRGTPEERSARARHAAQAPHPGRWSIPDEMYIPEPNTGCWLWLGWLTERGYPKIGYRNRVYRAHVLMYEWLRGPVPEGLELDHLCRVRSCVNPDHLEAVTHAENCRRDAERRKRRKQ